MKKILKFWWKKILKFFAEKCWKKIFSQAIKNKILHQKNMVLKEKTKKDILKIAIFRFLRIFFPKNPDFLEKYEVWGKKFFGISMTVHKRTSSKKIIEIGEVPVGP